MDADADDIDTRFAHHPPATHDRAQQHEQVREAHRTLVTDLDSVIPDGRAKALWLTKLEEAMFWGNAAVARQP